MKKSLVLLLSLTLIFLFSACSFNAGTTSDGKHNSSGQSVSDTLSPDTRLTEDEALDIALREANASKEDISGLRIELDRDGGIEIYEIDFYVGQTEYEYDIHAVDGTVLERDRDHVLD